MFCDNHGNLVVNEFEHLDANFPTSVQNHIKVVTYLENYYCDVLKKLLHEFNSF